MKASNTFLPLYVIGVAILFVILYFHTWPFETIVINKPISQKFDYPVVTKEIKAGEDLIVLVDYCKNLSVEIEYYIQFDNLDTNEVKFSTVKNNPSRLTKGCTQVNFHFDTPDTLSPGRTKATLHAEYKLSFLQSIFYRSEYQTTTDEFLVLPSQRQIDSEIIKEISTIINHYYVTNETQEKSDLEEQEDGKTSEISSKRNRTNKEKGKKNL